MPYPKRAAGITSIRAMAWYNKVLNLFVRDSLERKRFIDEFNSNAKDSFKNLSVDVLFLASTCPGKEDASYRHEFSAPRFASGFEIQVCGGKPVPPEDIVIIGQIILLDKVLVRRMYLLHWDTFIIKDIRTGRSIDWRIKDFVGFCGMLN